MKRIRTLHRTRYGKVILIFFGTLIALYLLLFTLWGNRLFTPLIEKSLSSSLNAPITVQEFVLTRNRFHLLFQDNLGNTLSTQGGFSLLTLRMYAHYRLEGFQYGGFNPLKKPFKTEGSLSGGIASFNIYGNAVLLNGHMIYKLELRRFSLSTVDMQLTDIAYEPLMQLLHYPCETDTTLTGLIALKGFDRRDVSGTIQLRSKTTRFKHLPIAEDSNDSTTLKSLLSDQNGRVRPFKSDVTMDLLLSNTAILEQFVGIPLEGKSKFHATLKGDEKHLRLHSTSDLAGGTATLVVDIPALEPSSVIFDLKHADAEQTFTLFALPSPIKGELSAYAELNTTQGKMQIKVIKGSSIPEIFKQHYLITQPLIHFDAMINADLSKNGVHYRAAFKSDLSRMEIDNTTTHERMLYDLLKTLPNGSSHR